ncbi:hypothetical protein R1flu_001197 [Riccia fluitans]|uniref:Uncharacterized protein n=1 Tax=Riccia fluitans TaxID=41844 RepID=A0ABD1Y5J6_9MARC
MNNTQGSGYVELTTVYRELVRWRVRPSFTQIASGPQGRISYQVGSQIQDPIDSHLLEERENGKEVKIYRLPRYMKKISPDDFEPYELRVGFYCHTSLEVDDDPMAMDISKVAILNEFCRGPVPDGPPSQSQSTDRPIRQEAWSDLVNKIGTDTMTKVRSKYDRLNPANEDSMKRENSLVILDALFIVAFFQYEYDFSDTWGYNFESVFIRSRFTAQRFTILRDLLMLENQVPMPLLLEMIKCIRRPSMSDPAETMLQNILEWFVMAIYPFNHGVKLDRPKDLQQHLGSSHRRGLNSFLRCDHLLQCAYLAICGPPADNSSPGEQVRSRCYGDSQLLPCFRRGNRDDDSVHRNKFRVPSATSLRRVGIKVRVRDDSLTMASIKFFRQKHKFVLWHEYVLLVPKLIMNDDTASVFRNIGMYEQIKDDSYTVRGDMRTYLYLMSSLLDTVQDVQMLINSGVIVNQLGSAEAVCKKWNHMCDGFYIPVNPPPYWYDLQKRISDLERSKSNKWFHEFRHRNLSSAVVLLSFIVVSMVVVAAFVQAIFSVLSYLKQ